MTENYSEVFAKLVDGTEDYVRKCGLKSLILGISGGIDSTVVAAIANEVSERVGIPFIGEKDARCLINGKNVYARILIKKLS